MKFIANTAISLCTAVYTIFYMSLNDLTSNEGALSKTGLSHPVLFFIWGTLVYIALYKNIFSLAKTFGRPSNRWACPP